MSVRRAALGCALAGAVAVAAAVVVAVTSSPAVVRGEAAAPLPAAAGALPVARPAPSGSSANRAEDPAPPAATARLRLPRLHVDARVTRVRLHGQVMQVPRDPAVVGWWAEGAVPGAAAGSAVVVGHVDFHGESGALGVLPRARVGDLVTLSAPTLRFRVVAVRSYPKSGGLPQQIFARTGPPQLVLVTCGGTFDSASGNYRDNVVVYAQRP